MVFDVQEKPKNTMHRPNLQFMQYTTYNPATKVNQKRIQHIYAKS